MSGHSMNDYSISGNCYKKLHVAFGKITSVTEKKVNRYCQMFEIRIFMVVLQEKQVMM